MSAGFDLFVTRVLVPIACIIAIEVGFIWGFSEGHIILMFGIIVLPILFRLVGNPELFFMLVYVCIAGSLTIPGLPQELMLKEVIALGLIGLGVVKFMVAKPPIRKEFGIARLAGFALIAVIIVHMVVRGCGFRAISGELWGGMAYVRVFIAFGFFVVSDVVLLSEEKFRKLFKWTAIASFIPGLAQAMFLVSGGALYQQYMFVRVEAWALRQSLYASVSNQGVVRYHFMAGIANTIIMIGLTIAKWRYLPLFILISIPAGLISGFRSAIFIPLMYLLIFALLYSNRNRFRRVIWIMIGFAVFLVCMSQFASSLPLSFQRALSIIPFYHVSEIARTDAMGTIEWRLDIWKIMLKNIPEYLFIGRGFAAEAELYTTIDPRYATTPEFAYYVHNYHNGPLGMLLDLGVAGLVSVAVFLVSSFLEVFRYKRLFDGDNFMNRYYSYIVSVYLSQVIIFFFFVGDTISYIPSMMFSLALIKVLVRTRKEELSAAKLEELKEVNSDSSLQEQGMTVS